MARWNDWMGSAACVVQRPDLPWTGEWVDATLGQLAAMTRTCHGCPVIRDCAERADRLRVTAGFCAGRYRDPHAPRGVHDDRPARTTPADESELGGAA